MDQNNEENSVSISGAIMPRSSGEQSAEQPRQPRTLQGLLRFAMQATKPENTPGVSNLSAMDPDRLRYLNEALRSITVNVIEIMKDAIKVLTNAEKMESIQAGQTLPEDVDIAFKNLLEYVVDIDVANDFYKIGGFAIFPICYSSPNDTIRSLTCRVVTELCQNNPFCQTKTYECGLLAILLHMIGTEKGENLENCVSAVSAATRDLLQSCHEFTVLGGCEKFTELMGAECSGIAKARASFLISYLCRHHPDARNKFVELDIAGVILKEIKVRDSYTIQHILHVLHHLMCCNTLVYEQCADPAVNLKKVVKDFLKRAELADMCEEDLRHCKSILFMLRNCPDVDDVDDEVER